MKEAGKQLFEYLKSQPFFTDVMNQVVDGQTITKLFPLMADGDTDFPFSIYGVRALPATKDGDNYEFALSAYFKENEYDECVAFLDGLKTMLDDSEYEWMEYSVEVDQENYCNIGTINFKT